jgi:hypothetical protein
MLANQVFYQVFPHPPQILHICSEGIKVHTLQPEQ